MKIMKISSGKEKWRKNSWFFRDNKRKKNGRNSKTFRRKDFKNSLGLWDNERGRDERNSADFEESRTIQRGN